MSELNFEKVMEAQMEEERPLVSLNVYNEEADIESEKEDSNSIKARTVSDNNRKCYHHPYNPLFHKTQQ